jgi:hypothetical protein
VAGGTVTPLPSSATQFQRCSTRDERSCHAAGRARRSHAICAGAGWRDSAAWDGGLAAKAAPAVRRRTAGGAEWGGKTLDLHCRQVQNLPPGLRVADARSVSLDWHHGSDEQVQFPPFPRDRYPSSGHALPGLPPNRRVPAGQPQRGPDRALPPGPSRSARPAAPVAVRGDPALISLFPRAWSAHDDLAAARPRKAESRRVTDLCCRPARDPPMLGKPGR